MGKTPYCKMCDKYHYERAYYYDSDKDIGIYFCGDKHKQEYINKKRDPNFKTSQDKFMDEYNDDIERRNSERREKLAEIERRINMSPEEEERERKAEERKREQERQQRIQKEKEDYEFMLKYKAFLIKLKKWWFFSIPTYILVLLISVVIFPPLSLLLVLFIPISLLILLILKIEQKKRMSNNPFRRR